YNAQLRSYVAYYRGMEPDASLLLMSRCGYLPARDPKAVSTCDFICSRLGHRGLLYRYPPTPGMDGIGTDENLFRACSFWLADYLARARRTQEAQGLLERLVGLANDVGLYAEEFHRVDFGPTGNFPQAYSHAGLISAALTLEQSLASDSRAEGR